MIADYSPNPFAINNPLIEALPSMLSGKELIHALACIPPYRESDRNRNTGERLQLLSHLYDFYQPMPMTLDLYCEVYNALQHCYGQYTPTKEAATLQAEYTAMGGHNTAASVGGGNSFSVIGVSGLGKSTALQRVLSLFPQTIEHQRYHGKMFFCHQIPYLAVQTPHDASIKALILDIYLQLDNLLGTSYQRDALNKRLSVDVLVSQLNQIVRINHIGLLVIDELQNIAYRKGDGGIRFLNFLVHLIDGTGVSVCMVGTPRVLQVLQQEFRSARRTTGLVYDRLENGSEFLLLLRGLWHLFFPIFGWTTVSKSWLFSCCLFAALSTLNNLRALKFRERQQHCRNQPPHRRIVQQTHVENMNRYTLFPQRIHIFQALPSRTAKPVHFADHQRIAWP